MTDVVRIPLDLLVWPCHDIDPDHLCLTDDPSVPLSDGPIDVERLRDGHYFVHDGRHRVIRAKLRGESEIDAITDRSANRPY